jgi:hypothetical protein
MGESYLQKADSNNLTGSEHDMISWCHGFSPTRNTAFVALNFKTNILYRIKTAKGKKKKLRTKTLQGTAFKKRHPGACRVLKNNFLRAL